MGVSDNVFDNAVPAGRVGVGEPIKECALFRILGAVFEIAALFVAEGLAVGDQKLEIARVGGIYIGIVNLVDDAVAEGEPKPAT